MWCKSLVKMASHLALIWIRSCINWRHTCRFPKWPRTENWVHLCSSNNWSCSPNSGPIYPFISLEEVDKTIQADPIPANEEARLPAIDEQQTEKSAEPSHSSSEQSSCPTHMEELETEQPELESLTALPLISSLALLEPATAPELEPILDPILYFVPAQTVAVSTPPPNALHSILIAMTHLSQSLTTHIIKVDTGMVTMRNDISTLFAAVKKGEDEK